ncbi:MAG: beta-galactosidase [Propionibacteriaceae bacterium]|jgi:beta-galactosidase|nr:beta-galactosidase [Propionibacteriaceae bacterium]
MTSDHPFSPQRWIYGADYNPEQWPEKIWDDDMVLAGEAGINAVTVNVFGWAGLQSDEVSFDFDQLDAVVERVSSAGLGIVMGTATASLPAWMSRRWPDVNRVDFEGRSHRFSHRHNHCPNSASFTRFASDLVDRLARRYASLNNLIAWHVSNEYSGACYCQACAAAFQDWVARRYVSIEQVNQAWNLSFWGHQLSDFADIVVPNLLGDAIDARRSAFPGLTIDYRRFMTDSIVANFTIERAAIRAHDQRTPITTNLMGAYFDLDYRVLADQLDVVSWDSYPSYDTTPSYTAMMHDLMYGLKSAPFMLMEQTPSATNWQPYNTLKRPGQMRALSYQAIAHGATTVQFFQLRRSIGGCEKFHSAVIDHAGSPDSRVFREVAALGGELGQLAQQLLSGQSTAQVAMIFDWPTWWAISASVGPTVALDYVDQLHRYYGALHRRGISIDLIGWQADWSGYDWLLAPCAYMMTAGQAARLEAWVADGGQLLTTMMSGLVDQSDNIHPGGYPGVLRRLTGIWVEEMDPLQPDSSMPIDWLEESTDRRDQPQAGSERQGVIGQSAPTVDAVAEVSAGGRTRSASTADQAATIEQLSTAAADATLAEVMIDVIHLEGAQALATVGGDQFYAGGPLITANEFGKGCCTYVGAALNRTAINQLFDRLMPGVGVPLPEGVELIERRQIDGSLVRFVINLSGQAQQSPRELSLAGSDLLTGRSIDGLEIIEPYGVRVLVG